MAITPINVGTVANDGTGDPIRQAFEKVNANEAELDSRLTQAEADIGNLDKSDVGLGNVDNTSDANKPISTATQTALNLKAPINNPTFTGTVGGITKAMVGLGNVDNTADVDKPVSAATQAALDQKVDESSLGVADGVATLDSGGKVPATQLPSYVDDVLEFDDFAAFPATGESGKIYVALDTNKTYRWSGSAYVYITSGAVDSVAGKTGVVTLVKADVGLGNVNNTSDANKPISTAAQAALDTKVDKVTGKGLSTEDYTTIEKNKLAGIAENATANSSDSYLLNSANHAYDNTGSGLAATDVQAAIDEVARPASETVAGLIEIATAAEAQAFTANKAIDGAKLAAAFGGANQGLTANGYQLFPGGLIIQWGLGATQGGTEQASNAQTITYPIAFPNKVLSISVTGDVEISLPSGDVDTVWQVHGMTSLTNFRAFANRVNAGNVNGSTPFWIAIGY